MNISINLLTTVAECDSMLEILEAEKVQVERRVRNLGEALADRSTIAIDVKTAIASTEAIIAGYQAAFGIITEKKKRDDFELKIIREQGRLKWLQNRETNYNAISIIEDELDYNQLEAQLPKINDVIAQVTAHKATL